MAANPLPTARLQLATEKTTGSIVHCTGRITSETAAQLLETAESLISESRPVVLDFTGVNYLDSSGIAMIVGLSVSAKRSGCKLRIVNLTPRVKAIFTRARLYEVLGGARASSR